MSVQELSERAKAVILLCSTVGLDAGADAKPFGPVGWHSLLTYVDAAGLEGPEALMGRDAAALSSALGVKPDIASRVAKLLDRAGRFTLDLERIGGWGIWVLTEFEAGYPRLLRDRLGDHAPPLLFGAGDSELLRCEGVAVVGSRRPDDAGMDFAHSFGARAAELGLAVVSGAARGVDEAAMTAALERGGIAVGVVADSLERLVRRKVWRQRLLSGELVLVSEHHPARRFDPGWAMQRNRVVYCLSQAAVVVASDAGRGGTWDGAAKNAKAGWVPLFVRAAVTAPAGNRRMLEEFGARELPDDGARAAEAVAKAVAERKDVPECKSPAPTSDPPAPPFDESSATPDGAPLPALRPGETPATTATVPASVESPDDVFPRVAALLVDAATSHRNVAAVAEALGVPKGQASVWLRRAVDEELLTKRSKGYASGPRAALESADALASPQAIAHAGVAAVERLGVDSCTQDEALRRIAATYCIDQPLARQWLAEAAAKLSQPLFTFEEDEPAGGDLDT
jgi:predicted Rossmann fold nucleotide-binding protein DprA/Smf involved in DNA uptake